MAHLLSTGYDFSQAIDYFVYDYLRPSYEYGSWMGRANGYLYRFNLERQFNWYSNRRRVLRDGGSQIPSYVYDARTPSQDSLYQTRWFFNIPYNFMRTETALKTAMRLRVWLRRAVNRTRRAVTQLQSAWRGHVQRRRWQLTEVGPNSWTDSSTGGTG